MSYQFEPYSDEDLANTGLTKEGYVDCKIRNTLITDSRSSGKPMMVVDVIAKNKYGESGFIKIYLPLHAKGIVSQFFKSIGMTNVLKEGQVINEKFAINKEFKAYAGLGEPYTREDGTIGQSMKIKKFYPPDYVYQEQDTPPIKITNPAIPSKAELDQDVPF
jgi:hypothetical protein